ncbi:MAG: globin [Oceanicoccus sp.]
MTADLIISSLEQVGERCEDPTALVYERLFTDNPEMKPLFLMDEDDAVKGQMLFHVIDGIIDFVGDRQYSDTLILSEIINHDIIGVPPSVFSTFFRTVMETFREIMGADWTVEFDQAWAEVLADLDEMIRQKAEVA